MHTGNNSHFKTNKWGSVRGRLSLILVFIHECQTRKKVIFLNWKLTEDNFDTVISECGTLKRMTKHSKQMQLESFLGTLFESQHVNTKIMF